LSPYVQQGKIKYRAHAIEGLENAASGLNMLFAGKNKGKLMVKL
ncbi:NADP-dependent oxidoreductase, partial [Alteromonas sp. 14N.309.X.WAT.G.H12]